MLFLFQEKNTIFLFFTVFLTTPRVVFEAHTAHSASQQLPQLPVRKKQNLSSIYTEYMSTLLAPITLSPMEKLKTGIEK